MTLALRGTALGSYKNDLPTWMTTLQCAEEWGVPPWVVREAPSSLKWAARRSAYRKALHKAEELNRKMNEK